MTKGGVFGVEAVEAVGLLVDEGVVLGDKLPSNFGGIDTSASDGGG